MGLPRHPPASQWRNPRTRLDTGDALNPPLRLDAILARVLADRCPSVQACPRDSALERPVELTTASPDREFWELCELFPDAPRLWSWLGSSFDDVAKPREWRDAAAGVLGFPVMLDCGDNNEVWVVRASPMPQNDQEQTP